MSDNIFDSLLETSAPSEASSSHETVVTSGSDVFDQLDAASTPAPKEEKVEVEPKQEEEKVQPSLESKSEEEVVEEVKEETSLEEKMLKESLKSEEEKQAEAIAVSEAKKLKAKVGKEYIEIPEDATFKVKIDGKYEVRTLAQLRDGSVGNESAEKRFKEASSLREEAKKSEFTAAEIKQQQREATSKIAKAWEKGTMSGIIQMAEEAGVEDVATYAEQIKSRLKQEIIEEMNMSPEQVELKLREDRVKAQEESMEIKRSSKAQEEHLVKLEAETRSVMEAYKIDIDTFEKGYKSLLQHNKNLDPSTLTPQAIGQWIQLENRGNFIMDQLLEIKPELASNYELIADITNRSLEAKLSDETIARLLKEQYSNRSLDKGVIAVNEKLKENTKHLSTKKENQPSPDSSKSNKKLTIDNMWD